MRVWLTVLSVVEILVLVAALAFYLARISRSLARSAAHLAKVTFGVRAIEQQCASIGPSVTKINSQLLIISGALDGLATKAERLGAAAGGPAESA